MSRTIRESIGRRRKRPNAGGNIDKNVGRRCPTVTIHKAGPRQRNGLSCLRLLLARSFSRNDTHVECCRQSAVIDRPLPDPGGGTNGQCEITYSIHQILSLPSSTSTGAARHAQALGTAGKHTIYPNGRDPSAPVGKRNHRKPCSLSFPFFPNDRGFQPKHLRHKRKSTADRTNTSTPSGRQSSFQSNRAL